MPQLNLTIAGRQYRMACGEGEEAHLEALARGFDAKIAELRSAFGEIGDMRLHVMAALTLCDELAEARGRVAALEADAAAWRGRAEEGEARAAETEARAAEAVGRTSERLERLARSLGS